MNVTETHLAVFFAVVSQIWFWWKFSIPFFATVGEKNDTPEKFLDWCSAILLLVPSAYYLLIFAFYSQMNITGVISVLVLVIFVQIIKPFLVRFTNAVDKQRPVVKPEPKPVPPTKPKRKPEPRPRPKLPPADIPIPDELRTKHMMIVAGSGHGKTQAMQELLVKDVRKGETVIVIDSQEGMLERLLHIVPTDRLVYLDPTSQKYPLAISAFDLGTTDEVKVQNSIALYEFMFSALGTTMTTKQSTLYRYLSRLLFVIPGANFNTALEILKKGAPPQYIPQLSETAQMFFKEQFMGAGFKQTRDEVSQRLFTLLDNPAMARMFNAPTKKVDIPQAIRDKRVILINTAQSTLGVQGATVFGRYCIAQIAMEVLARPETKERVYLYIDEAQEYLNGDPIIARLFEQGRKRGLCLVCAFHELGQVSDLVNLMRTNTAIKLVGGVNSSDATALYKDMQLPDAAYLTNNRTLDFRRSAKGYETIYFRVTSGVLEKQPKKPDGTIKEIKQYNFFKYSYDVKEPTPQSYSKPPKPDEPEDGDDAAPFDPKK